MMARGIGEQIVVLLKNGRSYTEISKSLGCSKSSISYHARRIGIPRSEEQKRYDWNHIQQFHDEGYGVIETIRHFGMSSQTWYDAVKAGRVKPNNILRLIPLTDLLKEGSKHQRGHIKRRLMSAGMIENRCMECGLTEWRGKPLTVHIDHINGIRDDWRMENLRTLCPNCHSQTDTFAGRNRKNSSASAKWTGAGD
jgi:hypothetical protein